MSSLETFFPFLLAVWFKPARVSRLTSIWIITTAATISFLAYGDTSSKNIYRPRKGWRGEERALKGNYGRHGIDDSFILLVLAELETLCLWNSKFSVYKLLSTGNCRRALVEFCMIWSSSCFIWSSCKISFFSRIRATGLGVNGGYCLS